MSPTRSPEVHAKYFPSLYLLNHNANKSISKCTDQDRCQNPVHFLVWCLEAGLWFQQHQLEKKYRLYCPDNVFVLSFNFFFSNCHHLCFAWICMFVCKITGQIKGWPFFKATKWNLYTECLPSLSLQHSYFYNYLSPGKEDSWKQWFVHVSWNMSVNMATKSATCITLGLLKAVSFIYPRSLSNEKSSFLLLLIT